MRTILFVESTGDHKAGDHVEVDDQTACDAIAAGFAVPSVDAIEPAEPKAFEPATENRATDAAPEVK